MSFIHTRDWIEGLPDAFADVAMTGPAPPLLLAGTQFCRGTAAQRKFEQNIHKDAIAIRTQLGGTGFQFQFVPLVWGPFSLSLGWLASFTLAPDIRDRLLKGNSWLL